MPRFEKRMVDGSIRGFSLIELLVVLIILGILATLVAPRIFGQLEEANVKAAHVGISRLAQAVDLYRLNTGQFPDKLEDLVDEPSGVEGWAGPYVKRGALNDPWKQAYIYTYPGRHSDYDIVSLGADQHEGGDKNDADIVSWE